MPIEIKMPKWGLTMEDGAITELFKKEGDTVRKDEPIVEVETEKILNEITSPVSGKVVKIIAKEGETYPVGAVLVLIEPEP